MWASLCIALFYHGDTILMNCTHWSSVWWKKIEASFSNLGVIRIEPSYLLMELGAIWIPVDACFFPSSGKKIGLSLWCGVLQTHTEAGAGSHLLFSIIEYGLHLTPCSAAYRLLCLGTDVTSFNFIIVFQHWAEKMHISSVSRDAIFLALLNISHLYVIHQFRPAFAIFLQLGKTIKCCSVAKWRSSLKQVHRTEFRQIVEIHLGNGYSECVTIANAAISWKCPPGTIHYRSRSPHVREVLCPSMHFPPGG